MRTFSSFPSFFVSAALALGALSLGTGCGHNYVPATPDGFIDLGDRYDSNDEDEYRSTTADGVVLGIRSYKNDPKADLALAVRALENRVRLGQGYALLDKKEVTAKNGMKGMTLKFGHDEAGGPQLYYVTIFIGEKRVFILEAGGKKDLVEKADTSIDWSIANFSPK